VIGVKRMLLIGRFIALAISWVSSVPGRADHDAGDDQRRVAEHEALEADRQAGEGVEQRDHHRHVGAADGQVTRITPSASASTKNRKIIRPGRRR
jgi:hypothetical protein